MSDPTGILEFDDVEEKVYLFAIPNNWTGSEIEEFEDNLRETFANAGAIVLFGETEEGLATNMEVHEADRDDLMDVLDYYEVMSDVRGENDG